MPARVEKIAREQLGMQLPGPGRVEIVRRGARAVRAVTLARPRAGAKPPAPDSALPRMRSPLVFGALALLFAALAVRSLYLQGIDNEFLQEQGSARSSREIELPAHRGRIVDRYGEALAMSTPMKSVWAFPAKVEATPAQLTALAKLLETTSAKLGAKLGSGDDFVYLARQVPPEVADRVAALRIKGIHDQNEYRRFYPAAETTSHILGFTGDGDVGQEGIELAQQAWLAGRPAAGAWSSTAAATSSRTSSRSARRRPGATSRWRSTRGCSTSPSAS